MNLQGRQNHRISSHDLGWTATRSPVAGEVFLLTSPFIERDSRTLAFAGIATFREAGWQHPALPNMAYVSAHGHLLECPILKENSLSHAQKEAYDAQVRNPDRKFRHSKNDERNFRGPENVAVAEDNRDGSRC